MIPLVEPFYRIASMKLLGRNIGEIWMYGRTFERINGRMNGEGGRDGRKNGPTDDRMTEKRTMNGRKNGRTDEWTGEWTNKWGSVLKLQYRMYIGYTYQISTLLNLCKALLLFKISISIAIETFSKICINLT